MVNNLALLLKPLNFNINKMTIVEIVKSLNNTNNFDVLDIIKEFKCFGDLYMT